MEDQRPVDRPTEHGADGSRSAAPPTARGAIRPVDRTTWPTTLGVISIVLGSLGLVYYPISFVMTMAISPEQGGPGLPFLVASHVVAEGLAGWLLGVGVGLARRRRWGAAHARLWAWAKIAFAVISIGLGFALQSTDAIKEAQAEAGVPAEMMVLIMVVGGLVSLGWALWLPVLLLVWLRRKPVRTQWEAWA